MAMKTTSGLNIEPHSDVMSMSQNISQDWLKMMPKVDLHLHLDGSIKPETIMALARKSGVSLPANSVEELLPYMKADKGCLSLTQYLEKFDFVSPFLQTAEALELAAFEVVEQAAEHRCLYIEVRFAPQLHTRSGLNADEVIAAVIAGLNRGEASFGVKARCIAICLRGHTGEMNLEVVKAAARYMGHGLVAIDLAGAEAAYPAELYSEEFRLARELGLPATIHAGEAAGAESVREAVLGLNARRIGHGIRMRDNSEVMSLIAELNIPLELCPVSNLQTKAVESWEDYPLRYYMDRGITVTVNTDNLTVSDTTITKEYSELCEHFRLSAEELCGLVMNGVKSAFLPEGEKEELMKKMAASQAAWLAAASTSTSP